MNRLSERALLRLSFSQSPRNQHRRSNNAVSANMGDDP